MSIHSQLPFDQSTSHARIPAGGIHLIASIDSASEAQVTASFFGSTKALHGEVAIPSAETSTHNHSNQQYSITAITTSSGAIAERYAYSAYGEPTILDGSGTVIASSAINNRYGYTGREWDATVGLYHFRARWMSPKTGRFLGRDPIGYTGSMWCLFEFVDGLPLHRLDPSGLFGNGSACKVIRSPKPEPCKMSGPESWVPMVCASSCLFTMQPVWQFGQIASSAQASAQTCSNNAIPGTPNDPNPIQNQAIRHCVASAILRCKLGRQCARCAANERENWQRMCADQTCSATLRGIDNNNNGIDLGIKCGSECEDCTQAMREGKLSLAPEVLDDQNPDPRSKELPPRGTIGNPGGPVKPII